MLDARDAPVEMEIDEEGAIKVLTALETEDPERLYFRVTEEREVHVEGVVARTELVEAFRGALLKFFRDDFDPAHWRPDGDDEDEREDGFVPLREAMLSDRWLNQGGG